MQFLTSLFGGSGNEIVTTVLALGIVIVLIVFGLWALKVLFRLTNGMGRRNRRLTVIDSVPIDARRRLVIVRRDNVEHLLLTGGGEDVVVETGIPVERPTLPVRRPVEPKTEAIPPRLAGRKAPPAPQPAPPLASKPPAAAPVPGGGPVARPRASGIDRLRELGRPVGQRSSFSLRHTGLMRPVSRMEPAIVPAAAENSDHEGVDSAKTGPGNEPTGTSKLGDATKGRLA